MTEIQRKCLRIKMVTMAYVTPHGIQPGTEITVRDLSTGGLGGYADRAFQNGTMLLFKIKLMTANNGVIAETLQARIAWTTKINGEGRHAFGAEFFDMKATSPRLYAYLKDLEEVPAAASS